MGRAATRPRLVLLACACLFAGTLAGIAACSAVPEEPQAASQRAQRMKADCERRGGIWYPATRSCTNSDPVPR